MVEEITREWKIGEILNGEVVKIAEFGAFVKLNANTDGLVHISELAPFRVNRVEDLIKEKMIVPVKIIKIDSERNKISLSIKEANPEFFGR
ncbi:MAG: S1 RNA-binding domain-containing protein [Patescibacteria group bacterium]